MSVTAVARRYGEALADIAIERNLIEQISGEVRAFVEMMRANNELHGVFASPVIPPDQKGRVLDAIIKRANPGPLTANLLKTLLSHHRLHYLGAVYEQFQREINVRRGTVLAEVTTAAPVTAAEQQLLGRKLQELTGKQVELQFTTDAALIGGVVTRIGSVVYDGSIRTQLQGMKQRLKEGTL